VIGKLDENADDNSECRRISVIKYARTISSSKNGFRRKKGTATIDGCAKKSFPVGPVAVVPWITY
jgi:hypothetical protein